MDDARVYARDLRSHLILEILETTALDDTHRVLENLQACLGLGVDISLDDFGTGYSSLDLFRRLQAQEIKIDRSFVMDMLENNDDYMIVSAIVSLSQSFGRSLVAEGIESAAVEAKLIELGGELGQGFFYSRPMPLEKALECLFCVSVMSLLTKASPGRWYARFIYLSRKEPIAGRLAGHRQKADFPPAQTG